MTEVWGLIKAILRLLWDIAILLALLSFMIMSVVYENRGDMQRAMLMILWAIFANMQGRVTNDHS